MKTPKATMTIAEMTRLGGLKGGPARAAKLSAKRRSEIARMGGLAAGKKGKKKGGSNA